MWTRAWIRTRSVILSPQYYQQLLRASDTLVAGMRKELAGVMGMG